MESNPPPAPTCPICLEPWACTGEHRLSCIPCGHMYCRRCLEWWLLSHGNKSAECVLCHQVYERGLIINLHAPGNLWDGCCRMQEELRAKLEEERARQASGGGDANTMWHIMSLVTDRERGWREHFSQMERNFKEQMAMANANLNLMKEQMNKIAEEKRKVCEELTKIKEQIRSPHIAIDPTDAMKRKGAPMGIQSLECKLITAPGHARYILGRDGVGPSNSNSQPIFPPPRLLRPSPVTSAMMKKSRDQNSSQNHR